MSRLTARNDGQGNKLFVIGGVVASVVLIAFGIASIATGINGRAEIRDNLKQEGIVGTPDMDKGVAGKAVDTGDRAKLFAAGMRKHTLEVSGGLTFAEMGRFLDKDGKPTNDEKAAAIDPKSGKPTENGARNIWVTETALSTALNVSYFAERVALFSVAMGVALLLTGIGFLVLVGSTLRRVGSPARASAPVPASA